ncbi:hypothetical protein FVER14953_21762 [Fusarium verticillioides]|nr:hypothetical protein FVER14953_21762 [Fusarium verticillioides]
MSNARNKRPAGPSEDEPNKKRGRPTQDELDSLAPEDSVSRMQTKRMLSRRSEIDYTTQDESSFYHDLMPWPETYEWSDEDDAAVAEEWQQSEIKEALKDLDSSQHNGLFLLFKISLRLYRILPTVLLSPVTGMRYTPVYRGSKEWIMSHKFCESLSKIMVHPCWEQDIDLLALALRWAVICRLDSRLKWCVGLPPYSCPVIQSTLENIEGCEGSSSDTSYHEMHKAEREGASERGESLSVLSDILYKLGEEVSKEPTSAEEEPGHGSLFGRCVLPVTQWDLDAIAKVVNQLVQDMYFKPQWNYTVEDGLAAWKAEKAKKAKDKDKGTELPLRKSLSRIYRLSYEIIFKWLRLQERQSSPISSDEADDEQSSDPFSSNENGSQKDTPPPRQRCHRSRQDIVDDSSSEEYEALRRTTSRLPVIPDERDTRDVEEEDYFPELPDDYLPPTLPGIESVGDDDQVTNTFDDGVGSDFGELDVQNTNESPELRPRGPTLGESFPSGRPVSPVYAYVREKKMLSELSELRKENKELRDGQKRLRDLLAEGIKEQNDVIAQKDQEIARLLKEQDELIRKGQEDQKQQMLDMRNEQKKQMADLMKELKSIKSELAQSRQANEAPNQGDAAQSHPERPSLPEATVIVPGGAPRSPDLGTNNSTTGNDGRVLQETNDVEPMEEDITAEPPVPMQKTPEPERSEQQVTTAPEVIQSAPEQTKSKQKTPEPKPSQQQDETVQEQHNPQLSDQSRQASDPRTTVQFSSQKLTKDSVRGLAKRPAKKERRIGSMTGLLSGQTPIGSRQRVAFKTPRSEILRMINNVE